jgi:transcriptional regulator with XRE-family HTH domain
MNALQQLIHARMTELHRSYGEIARRGGLPRSTVYHLASNNRPVRVPNPHTLERLAVGLEVPEQVVRAAAAAAAGFVLDEQHADDPEIEVLVASLAKLSAEERRHVGALVRSMLDAAGREGDRAGRLPEGNELISVLSLPGPSKRGGFAIAW